MHFFILTLLASFSYAQLQVTNSIRPSTNSSLCIGLQGVSDAPQAQPDHVVVVYGHKLFMIPISHILLQAGLLGYNRTVDVLQLWSHRHPIRPDWGVYAKSQRV